jgi:hypothetical protein
MLAYMEVNKCRIAKLKSCRVQYVRNQATAVKYDATCSHLLELAGASSCVRRRG